ncbi:TPA: hypothetical protein EYP66_01660 [Candidatus Poribacteria bacterium]|nr:hypothetical protein [Candidatus Poribacteria bacterium]
MMRIKFLLFSTVLIVCAGAVFAQKYQPAGDAWITKWWGMDLVTNTGGFNASAAHDWLSEGTGGKITDASVTTSNGLKILKEIKSVNLKNNGGELKWDIVTINPNDGNNMSTSHGLADQSNIEWYGIIVIKSPNNRKTKIHPAHDDYGHIWLNGEKVYNNPDWTTGATIVTRPTEITLKKGDNILLFRCGESGGSDYVNLHFEATDTDLKILPTTDGKFFQHVTSLPIEPPGKLASTWGDIKRR